MKIHRYLIFSFLFLFQTAHAQVTLSFQGNEAGDTWGFTTTGASSSAIAQANLNPNKISGTKSIVVGGNTGGGSCYDGGSGNGTSIDNKIIFQPVNIATSNENIRTLSFSWGSRYPICVGTGWDFGEDLVFTPIVDGVAQAPMIIGVGNNNTNFNIKAASQKYTYSIPTCVNSFAFELKLPTNRRDELLFVDDVKLSSPALNVPLALTLNVTGDAAVCLGNTSSIAANSLPGVVYEWSGLPLGANFTTPNNTVSSNAMTIDWGTANNGTYQIKVKPRKNQCGIDVYGAEVSFQVVVNNNPALTTTPSSTICSGDDITLTANGANNYLWDNGLGTNNSITVSPTVTTSYKVNGFNGNCSSSATVVVTVNQSAVSAGNDVVICEGNSVTLNATGGNNYSWDQGVVNGVPFTPTTTNTYTVTTTGLCAGTDQVLVTVEQNPSVDFTSNAFTGCLPLKVQFDNLSTGNNTYQWNFGDGMSSVLESPNHTFTSAGCKDISLFVTSVNGCVSSLTLTDFICVNERPIVQFTTDVIEINSNMSTVEFTNQTSGATTYEWNFGDGNFSTEFSTSHTFDPYSLENQRVTLLASNNSGCLDSAMAIIYFTSMPSVYVPNAFTPDGDEFNNVFIPKFGYRIDPTKYHLSIFNRWGELVFETYDQDFGWDGTFKGIPVQVGEYIWKMKYGIINGEDQLEKVGHVTVIR